jgi:hypothetical protein
MSATTYLLERDTTPYLWAGDYTPILKYSDHIPLVQELKELLTGKFKLVLEISNIQSNLYVNGKPCLVRKKKKSPITVYPNCRIIEGDDLGYGGSISYPCISFKKGFAVVEIITNGFPHLELETYRMKVKILELIKL